MAAVALNGDGLQYADESLRRDRDVVLAAVAHSGDAIEFADESLRRDRHVVLAAVAEDGDALQYTDESLRRDRAVVLTAVAQDGRALYFADDSLKRDRDVVLTTVARNGMALVYAHDNFKCDREIVLKALAQSGRVLDGVGESLGVVLAAIKQAGSFIYFDGPTRDVGLLYLDVVLAAVVRNGDELQFADDASLDRNDDIVLVALAGRTSSALSCALRLESRRDEELLSWAARQEGGSLRRRKRT